MSNDLGLVQHPSAVLRRVSRPVGEPDGAVLALGSAMLALMDEAGGVGLAAVQVGVPVRLFVARLPGLPAGLPPLLLDPEIEWASPGTEVMGEGCLSLPRRRLRVARHVGVRVAFTAADGRRLRLDLHGYPARIAQHEIDHLDGRLIIDIAEPDAPRAETSVQGYGRAAP